MRGDPRRILRRREPQLLLDVDWARDPFFRDTLSEYTSVMAIPVIGDRLPVTWAIGLKRPPKQFTVSDLEEDRRAGGDGRRTAGEPDPRR